MQAFSWQDPQHTVQSLNTPKFDADQLTWAVQLSPEAQAGVFAALIACMWLLGSRRMCMSRKRFVKDAEQNVQGCRIKCSRLSPTVSS